MYSGSAQGVVERVINVRYYYYYVTREHIFRIFELREILLSFQTGFNLDNTAVICAILESISALKPSSDLSEPIDHRKETQREVIWTCLPFIRSGQNHLARHS